MKTIPTHSFTRQMIPAIFAMMLSGAGSAHAFNDGDGSPENPYQVATAEHLDAVRNHMTAHFVQVADIDLGVAPWNEGEGWVPIGNSTTYFRGHYDGQDHTIDGLSINRTTDRVGLFGQADNATIVDLSLTNVNITGRDDVGALVGRNKGNLSNTSATGTVDGNNNVGGLVGRIADSTVTRSFADVNVSGANDVGGLVGESYRSTISSSFADSTVAGNDNVGGLLGHHYWGSNVVHCYATGAVSGRNRVGGLVGFYSKDSVSGGTVSHSYAVGGVSGAGNFVGGLVGYADSWGRVLASFWDVETTGQTTSSGGKGIGTIPMQTVTTFGDAGWGGHDWVMEAGAYPRFSWEADGLQAIPDPGPVALQGSGTEADPYLVTDAAEFASLSLHVGILNKHIRLEADIDLMGQAIHPIGDLGSFSGVFDGAGHTIMNARIIQPGASHVGIFAHLGSTAAIRDLELQNVEISGFRYVGGLVGYNNRGSLSFCHVTGQVTGTEYLGGLAGYSSPGVSDCNVDVDVAGTGDYVGGVFGYADAYWGNVVNCNASGEISGRNKVGGLVGFLTRGTISQSHASGEVRGHDFVGGLAGELDNLAPVENSHATADVIATGNNIGGLVGYSRGRVLNCSAAGNVSGGTVVGGLVGNAIANVQASYAVGDVTGLERVGGLVGRSASNMKNCHASGAVNGGVAVGGLIGYHYNSVVSHCYSTGPVVGNGAAGGLVGETSNDIGARVFSGFWDVQTSTQDSSADGAGLTTSTMQTVSFFQNAGWGAEGWVMAEGQYPRLPWEATGFDPIPAPAPVSLAGSGVTDDPYRVTNAAEFIALSRHVGILNKHLKLEADIDLTGQVVEPIGILGEFTGVFDGGGHVIANLSLDRPLAQEVGLFSIVGESGFIRGVALENVDVRGSLEVGALVGFNKGTVRDSYVTGQVAGVDRVGGLVGYNRGSLSHTYAAASVSGETVVGGLVGYINAGGTAVGALYASYASGDITASGRYVGGLVGWNDRGPLNACYATGAVSGDRDVGGLLGYSDRANVSHCYAAGAVTGTTSVGGLIGSRAWGTITASYWNMDTTERETSAGGVGLSTENMTYPYAIEAYEGWDFAEVWAEDTDSAINGGHPYVAYTLQYDAGPGGILDGAPVQRVPLGELSEAITVLPDAGAGFVGWSDGTMDNPRMDGRFSGNLSVIAHFRSLGEVDIDWYADHGIVPGEGQSWADVDSTDWLGKGMTLAQEFIAGTDPNDPQTRFAATPPTAEGTGFEIHFQPSLPERRYTLFRTTDLSNWVVVPGMQNVPGGNEPLIDAEPPEGSAFYRIEVSLP